MNIEFDAYKIKLNEIKPALDGLADSLNLAGLKNERERYQAMQEAPGFWDDPDKSQKIVVKAKQVESRIEKYEAMVSSWDDLVTICEMAAEEDDDSMLEELKEGFEKLSADMEACRLQTLLTGKYDKNNALVSFQAGAGGTEAQDWCQMLYRMYTRWAERSGFTYQILDYQAPDRQTLQEQVSNVTQTLPFLLNLGRSAHPPVVRPEDHVRLQVKPGWGWQGRLGDDPFPPLRLQPSLCGK